MAAAVLLSPCVVFKASVREGIVVRRLVLNFIGTVFLISAGVHFKGKVAGYILAERAMEPLKI